MSDIIIRMPAGGVSLPDNAQWTNRIQIRSESSNRIYIVAQNKESGRWGCSCPAYCSRRYCKHLLNGCNLDPSEIHGNAAIADNRPKNKRLK